MGRTSFKRLAALLASAALCLFPVEASATIGVPTNIGGANVCGSGAGTTCTLTPTTTSAVGTFVFVFNGYRSASAISACSDSAGNSWFSTTPGAVINASAARLFFTNVTTAITSSDVITCTFASTSGAKFLEGFASTGIVTTSPEDGTGTFATGTSTTPSSGTTAAITQASELGLGYVVANSSETFTEDATNGWTTLDTGSFGSTVQMAYKITTTIGTLTYAPTMSGSIAWGAVVQSFKASSGTTQVGSQRTRQGFGK